MASLHFYRYYLGKNGKRTNYNLVSLIDYMWHNLNSEERTMKIGDHWDTMSVFYRPKDDDAIRFFWIDKDISTNPSRGKVGTSNRKPVKGTLFNSSSCLLIPFYNLLIVFQPQGSPSSSEIAKYFMNYIKTKFGKNRFQLDILPIVSGLTFADIDKSYKVKNAYFTIDAGNINLSGGSRLIDGITDISNYTDRKDKQHYVIKVDIKNKFRKNYVSLNLVKSLINSIFDSSDDGILGAGLSVKGPHDHRFKNIRITKDSNILVPFNLNQKSPSWQFIFDQMYGYYENNRLPKETTILTSQNESLLKIKPEEIHIIDNPRYDFKRLHEL